MTKTFSSNCTTCWYLLLTVVAILIPFRSYADDASEPCITLKSCVTDMADSNFITLQLSATEETTFQVDCGFGKETYTVGIGGYDEENQTLTGTNIGCTLSRNQEVKIYGDPSLIDYFNGEGCYLTQIDLSKCVNLEFLNLEHNQLTGLDLTGLSKLRAIYMKDNVFSQATPLIIGNDKPNLSILEIPIVDWLDPNFSLTDYPNLMVFDAWACKTLTSIDTSKCPYLARLSIDSTPVASLDISKNPNLMILNIGDTAITEIDLTHNPLLTQFYCTHFSSVINPGVKLKSLDLSHNPELQILFAQNNAFTTLDITKNTKLTDLNIASNYLTSINLSKCPALYNVNISNNNMGLNTIPAPAVTYSEYYYKQRPLQINKSYKEGTTIDFGEKVIRSGSKTSATLMLVNSLTGEEEELDSEYFSFSGSVMTLKKEIPDSVYVSFYNNVLPEAGLRSTKFMVKNENDFGKPTKIISLKTNTSANVAVNMYVGIEKSEGSDKFYVDFGDGELVPFDITGSTLNGSATNVTGKTAAYEGTVDIYVAENDVLTALYVKSLPIGLADFSKARQLKELNITSCGLRDIDLTTNASLTRLELPNNRLRTIFLSETEALLAKNQLSYINLSNNELTSVSTNDIRAITHLNLSNNQLTEYSLRDADNMIELNLSGNQLSTLNLAYLTSATSVDISNNQITSIDMPETNSFVSFNCSGNKIPLSKLPILDLQGYTYAPQQIIDIPTKAPSVNLENQYVVIDGTSTVFNWYKSNGNPVDSSEIEINEGITKFLNTSIGEIYCVITHPAFPQFTGNKALKTTTVLTADAPTVLVASFKTLENNRGMELSLASTVPSMDIYFDWAGNGTTLTQYSLTDTYTVFQAKSYRDAVVKVYAYEGANDIAVFSLTSGSKLAEVDLSKLTNANCIAICGGQTTDITLPESYILNDLNLENNTFTSFDLSQYPNIEHFSIMGNQLTEFDASKNPALQTLALANNNLSKVTFYKNNALWGLSLSGNKLTSIDFKQTPQLHTLDLSDNDFETIDLSSLKSLRSLSLAENRFTFATLPLPDDNYSVYNYANQAALTVTPVDGVIDLSSIASRDNIDTEYFWYEGIPSYDYDLGEIVGTLLEQGVDYTIENGVTTFLKKHNQVVGVFMNSLFPNLIMLSYPVDITELGVRSVGSDKDNASIFVKGNRICVRGACSGTLYVYNLAGSLISTTALTNGHSESSAVPAGIYVAKCGGSTQKVIIKN